MKMLAIVNYLCSNRENIKINILQFNFSSQKARAPVYLHFHTFTLSKYNFHKNVLASIQIQRKEQTMPAA